MNNCFQLTRAADLDDEQITRLWVDPRGKLGGMLRPASPLPMLLLGGRGSGKTHLLRYFSYPVQRRVYGKDQMRRKVSELGYIGIHTRCVGHNTSRFSAKRIPSAQWDALFSFYLELWFGQLLLNTAIEFLADTDCLGTFNELELVEQLVALFDSALPEVPTSLTEFSRFLRSLQRNLDNEVNMASFRLPIVPKLLVTPGRLTFGIPQTLAKYIPVLEGLMFTLFVDEYEHLFEEQQKHVNTLIRERENPVSFKIGARLHGMRTYQTWGGDEELKEGSDYELINLDAALRSDETQYYEFALQLCLARVKFEFKGWPEGWNDENARPMFESTFVRPATPESLAVAQLTKREEAPWLTGVRSAMENNVEIMRDLGVTAADRETVVNRLAFPKNVLVEKTNTFLFYRAWSKKKNLLDSATAIAKSALAYTTTPNSRSSHARLLKHFREDMRDQILADLDLDQRAGANGLLSRYLGIDAWIRMSDGIIRNLIIILKHVYDWSFFRGESAFSNGGISLDSQAKGVQQASIWFVSDANVLEADRGTVETGMKRTANLLRKIRFSAKPPECSLCRFSVNLGALKPAARRAIQAAEMWSLLIRDSSRRGRNPGEHLVHLRINPLVAPDYYLPIAARGNIDLSSDECEAIFGTSDESGYRNVERDRLARCTPPFGMKIERNGRRPGEIQEDGENEFTLF